MQTSLNPLISTVIKGGHLASTLTFGQFVKAIASFLAPYLAMWGAMGVLPTMGLGWRALFVIYLVMGIFATLLLAGTPIEEELFLRLLRTRIFFIISVVMMALSMAGLFFGHSQIVLYTAIALVGYGNSNVFSMIFSQALTDMPEQKNEVSGLMIMGLFGGTVFPLLMGFASDAVGQMGAVAVMAVGVIYLFSYIGRLK